MNDLIWNEFRALQRADGGVQLGVINFTHLRARMYSVYPEHRESLTTALRNFILERSHGYSEAFAKDSQGRFLDDAAVLKHLKVMRPDLDKGGIKSLWHNIRDRNLTAAAATTRASSQAVTALGESSAGHTRQMLPAPSQPAFEQSSCANGSFLSASTTVINTPQTMSPTDTEPLYNESYARKNLASWDDTLAKKLKQLQLGTDNKNAEAEADVSASISRKFPDLCTTTELLKVREAESTASPSSNAVEQGIRQAPIVGANIVTEHYEELVPQYGLLGSLEEESETLTDPQLFLNTNVPFSAFICGVQGSGKSHTTSCILENSILASSHLGHLESPVSTLVFSYGEWSSGGTGFNISEATCLGSSHPNFPNQYVRKVTVLYSPSNPAIKRMYERLPNVQMVPFRLKAKTLDIGALHSLMAVDEKSTMPLYMATVEAILRDIATKSADGSMDYIEFKRRIAEEKLNPDQSNMLGMRMNLLESFLDLDGTASDPNFRPGEVTIIDLSDPFLTPSTACILFKLALEQFLQSGASGKMVVLDEAHKYMLDTPGSKIFTNYLTRVIRLQRHHGARVVISTQEPTIATNLIALCSVTIMHRFTSPAWYSALRKHVNAVESDGHIMQRIEALETGEALIYCPNAVLGKRENGSLIKATGKLMRVNVRNRITLDGGVSIMAV